MAQAEACGYIIYTKSNLVLTEEVAAGFSLRESMEPKEHPHRLDRRLYQGRVVCSFTCCVQDLASLFTMGHVVSFFEQKLLESLEKNRCGAHVYLFMPDHLHLLVEGFEYEADLWRMVVDCEPKREKWESGAFTFPSEAKQTRVHTPRLAAGKSASKASTLGVACHAVHTLDFKQQTGYWLSINQHAERWQKDFFDHILRKDEDVLTQVAYILDNPVRAGLLEDWRRYPYRGSTIYDLDTLEL